MPLQLGLLTGCKYVLIRQTPGLEMATNIAMDTSRFRLREATKKDIPGMVEVFFHSQYSRPGFEPHGA